MPGTTTIVRYSEQPQPEHIRAGIDRIFFETAPLAPTAEPARAAFHDLWLGQYLRHEPQLCHVALDGEGCVLGYLVGCLTDLSTSPRFAQLSYVQAFAEACQRFPAHLHLNLTAAARGHGLGVSLIEAFVDDVRAAGLPGLHVVTGAGLRNVRFYERIGFTERARTTHRSGEVVLLGRVA